jgi:3-deoxy-D-manno-octulosonic-acid transferase
MYAVYTLLTVLAFVVASPWFAWQAFRHRKYVGSLGQRLGRLPVGVNLDEEASIWVHAVSVGEVLAARALIPDLRERYPRLRIFLSTTTRTGQQVAQQRVAGADGIIYFPLDLPFSVRRTMDRIRPRLFVMVETEIWPTLLRACRARGVKTALVNGRISARSYPRYRLVRPFLRRVLADVDLLCMQSEESARRIVDIGALPERVSVTGSLKFDALDLPGPTTTATGPDRVLRYFRVRDGRCVVMAASTLRGEEGPVLTAFREVQRSAPDALLVLAPRHPERFDEVTTIARGEGFRVERRSALPIDAEPRAEVVVLDTLGELARLFQVATLVFVGGSLVEAGGHNILEPAVFGKPVVFGPHMQNFAEIAAMFLDHGAALQVATPHALTEAFVALAGDPVQRARLGAAARALVAANRGARQRTLEALAALLPPGTPRGGVVMPFRRAQ